MINLVSNILDMSKIAADKMQMSPVPTDLRELSNRVLRTSQGRAEGKAISLEFDCDRDLPPAIDVDPQRIEQVMVNLVSNAIKFTPTKGRIVVKVEWTALAVQISEETALKLAMGHSSWKQTMELSEEEQCSRLLARTGSGLNDRYTGPLAPSRRRKKSVKDRTLLSSPENPRRLLPHPDRGLVKVEVMDTGIGISKEGVAKLFRPYQQADDSISRYAPTTMTSHDRKYGGTGLGLWISMNILRKMQGDIRVKSRPGRGSNFVVAFPAHVSKEVVALTNAAEEIPGADVLKGKHYILLDDVAESAFVLAESLKRYGVGSTIRQTGIDALELYKSTPQTFDGIVTDLRMPTMSGQTFIQEVRAFERARSGNRGTLRPVPIVVMTAEAAMEEKRLCLTQYGANAFLLKPVKLRDLISSLAKVHSAGNRQKRQKGILVLDDDVVGSRFLVSVLSKAGHRCEQAFSVAEGVKIIEEQQRGGKWCDIVMLDNLLGDGTGPDFLQQCEKSLLEDTGNGNVKRRRRIKVISISGNEPEDQRRMYESAGRQGAVDGYLQKPVKKQDLLGLVQIL